MAYAAWSVVAFETPTAAKWNILGTNDASFHDGTGIDDNAIINRHLADDAVHADNIDFTTLITNYDNQITRNAAAVSSIGTAAIDVVGGVLFATLAFTLNAALDDTTTTLGTLNIAAMGIATLQLQYPTGWSDGGNGIGQMQVSAAGAVISNGWEPAGLTSGDVVQVSIQAPIRTWV